MDTDILGAVRSWAKVGELEGREYLVKTAGRKEEEGRGYISSNFQHFKRHFTPQVSCTKMLFAFWGGVTRFNNDSSGRRWGKWMEGSGP